MDREHMIEVTDLRRAYGAGSMRVRGPRRSTFADRREPRAAGTHGAGKTSTVVRPLPAGDERLIRGALAALLGHDEDERVVVAEAATGPEALALARARRPDVAVPGLQMPGADGSMM